MAGVGQMHSNRALSPLLITPLRGPRPTPVPGHYRPIWVDPSVCEIQAVGQQTSPSTLKPSTVRVVYQHLLRAVFRAAEAGPVSSVATPLRSDRGPPAPSDSPSSRLYPLNGGCSLLPCEAASRKRWQAAVRLMAGTGLRPAEGRGRHSGPGRLPPGARCTSIGSSLKVQDPFLGFGLTLRPRSVGAARCRSPRPSYRHPVSAHLAPCTSPGRTGLAVHQRISVSQ